MKIEDVKNMIVKLSPRSITCKNEYGKTCGVVRGIEKFNSLQPNLKFEYFEIVKKSGVWGCKLDNEMDRIYCCNKKLYYLFNLYPLENYENFEKKYGVNESSKTYYEKRKKLAVTASEVMTVIPCYILEWYKSIILLF